MLPYAIHPQSKLMILLVFIQVQWKIRLKLSHFLAIFECFFFFYEKTSKICVERFSSWVRTEIFDPGKFQFLNKLNKAFPLLQEDFNRNHHKCSGVHLCIMLGLFHYDFAFISTNRKVRSCIGLQLIILLTWSTYWILLVRYSLTIIRV